MMVSRILDMPAVWWLFAATIVAALIMRRLCLKNSASLPAYAFTGAAAVLFLMSVYTFFQSTAFRPPDERLLKRIEEQLRLQGTQVERNTNRYIVHHGTEAVALTVVSRNSISRAFASGKHLALLFDPSPSPEQVNPIPPKAVLDGMLAAISAVESGLAGGRGVDIDYFPLQITLMLAVFCFIFMPPWNGRWAGMLTAASAFMVAASVYWPYIHFPPDQGFPLERLIHARQSLYTSMMGADARHPFIFFWLLKIADVLFPHPEALYITGILATSIAAGTVVWIFQRFAQNALAGFMVAVVMVLSPAFVHYAIDIGPFSTWFAAVLILYAFMEAGHGNRGLVAYFVSLYITYAAWLYLPWFLAAYKRGTGRYPRRAWLVPGLLSLALTFKGLSGDWSALAVKHRDSVNIIWTSDSLADMLSNGLYYLSPAGLPWLGVLLLAGCCILAGADLFRRRDPRGALLVLPPAALLAIGPLSRIKARYQSLFFTIILLWGSLRLFQRKRHLVETAVVVSLAAAVALYCFIHYREDFERVRENPHSSVLSKLDGVRDVWAPMPQYCRQLAYFNDPDSPGKPGCVNGPVWRCGNLTCSEMFFINDDADLTAANTLKSWTAAGSPFAVLLDRVYNTPPILSRFVAEGCLRVAESGTMEAYVCQPPKKAVSEVPTKH